MGVYDSPKIVTDGLVLCLDAGNRRSYPGIGTTWTDLSEQGNNGTLVSGVGYDVEKLGALVFDGVDDYVGTSDLQIFDNFCYDIWCLPQSTHQIDSQSNNGNSGETGQKWLLYPQNRGDSFSGAGISLGTNGVSVYEHANFYIPALLVHSTTIDSATNIVINYINKQPFLYINGVFIKSGLVSPRAKVQMSYQYGSGAYGAFNGKIYNIKSYNRALTEAEIQQNYNALKSRTAAAAQPIIPVEPCAIYDTLGTEETTYFLTEEENCLLLG